MKAVIFVFLAAACVLVSAAPAQERELSRVKRVTCDLFSIEFGGIKVNDGACAVKCIAWVGKGYHGGHCKDGICTCNKGAEQ
ncbi:Tenecin-1 [Blattella germanica]|nr:Tenecin-1 [Blattella germanica]PSN36810.1 Tenecin-1 [Blattella germanica]